MAHAGTAEVMMTLRSKFESFDEKKKRKFRKALVRLIGRNYDIRITRVAPGSTNLTVQVLDEGERKIRACAANETAAWMAFVRRADLKQVEFERRSDGTEKLTLVYKDAPPWMLMMGCLFGGVTLLFLIALVILGLAGLQVRQGSRGLVVFVLGLGVALASGFLGAGLSWRKS